MGQHLQGHILEGAGGAVPQLQAVGLPVHLPDGGDLPGVKFTAAVCLRSKARQLGSGEFLRNEPIT